jgi:hypothetical protein
MQVLKFLVFGEVNVEVQKVPCEISATWKVKFVPVIKYALRLEGMWVSGFLNLGSSWRSTSRFCRFTSAVRAPPPRMHLIGICLGPRVSLDDIEKRPYFDSNSDPSVVQPVASRYPDYATRLLQC